MRIMLKHRIIFLIRKLYLAKEYQNLAEGEQFLRLYVKVGMNQNSLKS